MSILPSYVIYPYKTHYTLEIYNPHRFAKKHRFQQRVSKAQPL